MDSAASKLCLVSSVPATLWVFYRQLISALPAEGFEVGVVCSEGPTIELLRASAGTHVHPLEFGGKSRPCVKFAPWSLWPESFGSKAIRSYTAILLKVDCWPCWPPRWRASGTASIRFTASPSRPRRDSGVKCWQAPSALAAASPERCWSLAPVSKPFCSLPHAGPTYTLLASRRRLRTPPRQLGSGGWRCRC